MNKTYRNIWNATTRTWTAVAETAKSHSKGSSRAARQAVIAIALGGAAISGAAAAEVCTTESGSSGTVDDAGVCQAVTQGAIGTMGSVGTMAGGWSGGNGISIAAGAGTANAVNASDIAIGNGSSATGGTSTALGNGATVGTSAGTAIGANSTSTASYGLAIGAATRAGRGAIVEATGSVAIGTISHVTSDASNAVALGMGSVAHEANTVSVGAGIPNIDGATFTRRIVNVSAGSADTDAVNLGQLRATNAAVDATNAGLSTTNASLASTQSELSTTNVSLASTQSVLSTAQTTIATHTTQIDTINDQLNGLSDGTIGLVQQSAAGADLTVGATTDGAAVNLAGTAGNRKLTGIAAGDVSAASTDAVNGSQLHGVADSVASAIGGGSTVNPDGSISAPTFTVGDGSGGTKTVNSVGDVVTNIDGRVTNNEGSIKDLAEQIGSGTVGLVQQANPADDITVGANTGGNAVDFSSKTGTRTLTGITAGDVSATSTDAVNGSQLHGVADSVASAIGGGSTVNPDGSIAAPAFTVGDGSGGTKIVNSVGDVVTNIDGRVTNNEGKITDLAEQIGSGTVGLVQQSAAGADLTVGANTDGGAVNFAGTAGNRKLTGVASGDVSAVSADAVNGSQLHGVADSIASAIGGGSTVNADGSISAPTFTVGDGSGGTKVVNSVGDVVSNLDGRTTTNEGDIKKLADDIGSGTVGLVQQANPGDNITVGANTDGAAVNFAGTAGNRKLTGIAAGDVSAASSEAVNGSQLHGVADSVASAIGGGSTVNVDGSISAPSFTVGDGSGGTKVVNSVGDVITNLDGRTTTTEGDIKDLAEQIGSGTVGLVQQANPGDDITVGANTGGNAVNFSSKTGTRKLTGITAGDVTAASTDAVNGSQLHGVADSVASAIGGGSTVNPDGSISAPTFTVGDGSGGTKTVNSVGDVVTNIDGRVTNNEGSIKDLAEQIGSGTVGLVQQANPADDITVGANTGGNAVDFSSKTGTRTLTGITAGDVSATSTDAVNGSQLHGVADSVASAIGGGSTVNPDGSIAAPAFTVGDGSGGTKIVNSVGDVVTNLDGRTTTNEGDIKKLADEIGSGTVGLVQQANPGDDITVGANTNGNAVNFSGKTGTRKLTGITAGDVTAASTDAVNGSQLHGVADSVASAIGGGSTVNADGSISAPRFTVGDGSGGTKIVNSVGDVVTNLNDRVTHNEGGIKDLADQLGSGTVGLVRQDATSGMITVGAGGAGSVVNFAGSGGPRVLSGVANGVHDDDVVTISQLRATGLIDYLGKEVGAVTYDTGLSFDSVTFSGTNGTVLKQVAAGRVDHGSMEAVNGGQLYALQEQFAKQYGDLSSRVGELETNPNPGDPGTGGPGAGGPGTGDGSTVVGEGADASGKNSSAIGNGSVASGENSSAVGQGSVASGSNSSAVGQGSVASGDNSSAIGQGSVASGEGSTALGQGATASGNNSIAVGQGSVATEANTVSFGDGTEAGNRRIVNIADGINASDAATKGQLDRAMESVDQRFNDTNRAINDVAKNAYAGIAAAMAMPNMTPSQPGKTVVAVGAANFKSGSAIAAGATYRSRNGNWLVNGATSVTSVGDVGIRAQVGYEF
ncbi:ESPR-type extended signal peptide-containing protein [Burkholderia orbicola]|uniref:ESPR-type extended signal peptide-containing protein n=1 Tax=Burkholderia orbicola TaxID=2978683 RepID=UPI002FE20F94